MDLPLRSSSADLDSSGIDIDDITDFFLPADQPRQGVYFPGRVGLEPRMYAMAMGLVDTAKRTRLNNCTVSFEGRSFRCTLLPTYEGDMYIFRRMPNKIMTLKDCGFPQVLSRELLSPRLIKGGLIIVSGLPGNGKSTTLASCIVDRLTKFGGICMTVEDPVEMPLQGFHGNGYCLQRSISGEEELSAAIKDTLRAYPAKTSAMMMIGEIRDHKAAAVALRSAVDGRLVMLTMHAGDIIQSLQRLCSFAAREMPLEEVRELLASSFRIAIHQTLVKNGQGRTVPKLSALLDTQSVAGTIKQRHVSLENLKNDVQFQQNLFRSNQPIDLRPID